MAQIHTSVILLTSRDLTWSCGRLTCQHASQAGDTLSSRHVSSCDVTSAVGNVRGYLTLNSVAQIYVTWSRVAALVGSRASTPIIFLLSHTFRETWRTCRVLFRRCYQLFPEMEEMLTEKLRQRTFLYTTRSPDYRDYHMRANVWEGIGKEVKIKRKLYVLTCMCGVSSRHVRIVCPRLNSFYSHVDIFRT